MRHFLPCLAIAGLIGLLSSTLPADDQLAGTKRLEGDGDFASQLVAGVDRFLLKQIEASVDRRARHWKRDFASVESYNRSIEPNRRRLAHILGMRDPRVAPSEIEFRRTTTKSSKLATAEHYDIHEVRWAAFGDVYGRGLMLRPKTEPKAFVVAISDSSQTPEQLCGLADGVADQSQFARRLAENGCAVVVVALIDRGRNQFQWHGRRISIPHREFLYRSAYEVGRHLIGYEVHKALAAIDHRPKSPETPVGVIGYGDGGMLALYAAALDPRIRATVVSGYVDDRNTIWRQPLDRNVFSLLEQFGDAELAAMVAPRKLIVEASDHPNYELPAGSAAAPAKIVTPRLEVVDQQIERAREYLRQWKDARGWLQRTGRGAGGPAQSDTLKSFLAALGVEGPLAAAGPRPTPVRELVDAKARLDRQMREIDRHTQHVLRESPFVRREFMSKVDHTSLEAYRKSIEPYREFFRHEVIGHFDRQPLPANVRTRRMKTTDEITYYEVVMDVFPDVIAYGILCLPNDVKPGERRPVVVCQHGLEGRPQSVIGERDHGAYKAFATELARRGFVTFAPQNLYIFQDRFRTLQRKAYPIKKTLFSIIVPQHQQIVDWLQTQPFVDPDRIALYGLSYGGKTAMRVPPLVTDYCLSICSADFNEWVNKNASTRNPRSYVWAGEYEIFEWDLGGTFNYAEMAALIAPRPFMVERGHHDGVADDWTVGWEFAKVRHRYQAQLKIGDRCEIEWFDGPHAINGQGTYRFLHRHLNWPQRK